MCQLSAHACHVGLNACLHIGFKLDRVLGKQNVGLLLNQVVLQVLLLLLKLVVLLQLLQILPQVVLLSVVGNVLLKLIVLLLLVVLLLLLLGVLLLLIGTARSARALRLQRRPVGIRC